MEKLIAAASGRKKADIVYHNARIVNVFTHEIIKDDFAVSEGKIVGIGQYAGEEVVDMGGRYIAPGLIDSHVHIESSLISPEQFACLTVPRGTTCIIADPHEIANVCGIKGIRYMIGATRHVPMDVYFMIPSCVPAVSFEHAGAVLNADDIETIMDDPSVLGLGEMMDYISVINMEKMALDKLQTALKRGKRIDGHSPMVTGKDLAAYICAGVETDHECSTAEEMRERLRLGMRVLIREGSAAKDLLGLVSKLDEYSAGRCSFCTDDKQIEDIINDGHIDHNVRLAIENGINPITAIQMGTINAAQGYGLYRKGAIAPGYDADFITFDSLETFNIQSVYKAGRKVAENHQALFSPPATDKHAVVSVSDTVRIPPLNSRSFELRLKSPKAHVISIVPGSLITKKTVHKVSSGKDGVFQPQANQDIKKLAVIERHKQTGNIGLGLIENYGICDGAVGLSIAHDSHNLVICGDNDSDILMAANEIARSGGGIVLIKNGQVIGKLPLPIAGLMSGEPALQVNDRFKVIVQTAHDQLSVNRQIDPVITLAFMTLPVIPELKLTDQGLFDVNAFEFIDINA